MKSGLPADRGTALVESSSALCMTCHSRAW